MARKSHIQVEAKGLKPLTKYYYQFTVCGSKNKSPMGRTKTAPAADDDVSNLSFAVFSCSNYRESPEEPLEKYLPNRQLTVSQPADTSTRMAMPPGRTSTTMSSTWAITCTRQERGASARLRRRGPSSPSTTTALVTAW